MYTIEGFLGNRYGGEYSTREEAVEVAFKIANECQITLFVANLKGQAIDRIQYLPERITRERLYD